MKIKVTGEYLGGPNREATVTMTMSLEDWDRVLSRLAAHLPEDEYEQPLYATLENLRKKAEVVEYSK